MGRVACLNEIRRMQVFVSMRFRFLCVVRVARGGLFRRELMGSAACFNEVLLRRRRDDGYGEPV